ncbi:hypothetical protein F5887DRAFT_954020 [Amanita rubescens]|nr:hypothetical protein F5887DRAFT_954020 [Amanita rubescens]
MATKLYETLGVSKTATIEDIRKAYKRKALQTHPDRLPQGSTPEDKANSEEQFRLVNNAYEILSDPQKRSAYDTHGIFPPPEPERDRVRPDYGWSGHHRHSRSRPFGDPFMSRGFSTFSFTDPFALFDEIFGQEFPDWHHHRSHHHHHSPFRDFDPFFGPFSNPLNRSPLGLGGLLASMERDTFGLSGGFPSSSRMFSSLEPPRHGRGPGFVQESFMTQMINGVSQSVHRRRDTDGNEHVTRTFPDGRQVYTVNGVEQPAHGYPSSSEPKESRRIAHHNTRGSSSQAHRSTSQAQPITVARSDYPPPSPYPGYEQDVYNAPTSAYRDHRRRGEYYAPENEYEVHGGM